MEPYAVRDRVNPAGDAIVLTDSDDEVDSMASKHDESFWVAERQVPLTEAEVIGYKQADSLQFLDKDKLTKDSLRNLPVFRWTDLISSRTYIYEKRNLGPRLSLGSLSGGFNPVDGYTIQRNLEFRQTFSLSNYYSINANIHYAFARKAFNGDLEYLRNFDENRQRLYLGIGSNVYQINATNPVSESYNKFYSLLLNENYLKLYQKNFMNVGYEYQVSSKIRLSGFLEFRHRQELSNHVDQGFFSNSTFFTSNDPLNNELGSISFQNNNQLVSFFLSVLFFKIIVYYTYIKLDK